MPSDACCFCEAKDRELKDLEREGSIRAAHLEEAKVCAGCQAAFKAGWHENTQNRGPL